VVPRSVSPTDVIGSALRIYGAHAGPLLLAALLIFAVDALATYLLRGALALIASVVTLVAGAFYQGMVAELVRDVQDGRRDASLGQLLRSVAPVAGPLVAVSLLYGVGVAVGFVLLVVPGLLALTFWAVAAPVTVLERPGVFAAFRRSRELVRGSGAAVFGTIVLVFLIVITVGVVASVASASAGDGAEAVVQWLLSVVAAPITAVTAAVLYFALRREHGEADEPAAAAGPEHPAHAWQAPRAD
jgi:MFS family permease